LDEITSSDILFLMWMIGCVFYLVKPAAKFCECYVVCGVAAADDLMKISEATSLYI